MEWRCLGHPPSSVLHPRFLTLSLASWHLGVRICELMTALCDHDLDSLTDELRLLGHNASHARMLLRQYYENDGVLPAARLPITKALRASMEHPDRSGRATELARRVASDSTVKLLLGFGDGTSIETVLMPSHRPDRAAGCVSSQ